MFSLKYMDGSCRRVRPWCPASVQFHNGDAAVQNPSFTLLFFGLRQLFKEGHCLSRLKKNADIPV